MPAKHTHRILRGGTTSLALAAACAALAHAPGQTDLSKGNTLYVVPYAHLDTQWRWAYPQVIREYIANTLSRNFALIDKYPNYVFNFSGSRRYEMMKEYYPQDYLRMKGYIQAGRWFPCGSSVDEGDANVPSAESIVRHVLYGNRYFRKEFGVASQEFMLPDCFGFPYSLPSILSYCGVKGFSTQKLTWGSSAGIPFKIGVWEGPDGRSVVAALDPGSYGADVTEDLSQNTSWLARIQNTGKISGAYVDYHYYGTGDQGGAPRENAVKWMEKSVSGTGPIKVKSSKADDMFKALTPGQIAKLPRYKGELLLTEHSAGSITSEAFMKRSNRKTELLADAAEKSSIAALLVGGTSYPSARLYNAWDLLLGSQMHDMLPGTSIPKAYEYCWNDFLLAQNQFAAIEKDAVGAVSQQLDTRGHGVALVVFNPLSVGREDVTEATIKDISGGSGISVKGPDGQEVQAQILSRKGGDVHIAFVAKVPSTGFAVFEAHASHTTAKSDLKVDGRHVENARFKVTVNQAGDIASIFDKATKKEILKAPSRLEMQFENPAQFPAWNMDWDDAKLPPRDIVDTPAKFRVVENGPTRVTLEVEREKAGSKFVQDIRLTKGGQSVEVVNNIDWRTKERALKASFPLTSTSPIATYDLQLGTTTRSNAYAKKFEVPQHLWFDVTKTDGSYGTAILNDSKFASDKPTDSTVRLTLLYTPGVRGGYEDQATQDFGRHQIIYQIAPHKGSWQAGDIPWQAKRLNQPLKTFVVPAHSGPLGKSFSIVSTNSGHVEIQALKKSEDGNELVVRLRELNGTTATGVKVHFAEPVLTAREVNGQEQPLGSAKVEGGSLVATVPAYTLKSYAVKLKSASESAVATVSKQVALPYNVDVISTNANPGDGQFAKGKAIAAEQLPTTLTVDDVKFAFGPKTDHSKNAVVAQGQTIKIPSGYSKVYVLAAADSDTAGTFKIGNRATAATIQGWLGYVGQWDNRSWSEKPGANFQNYGTMTGLTPGYVKPAEVAWFASHSHTATGNTYYEYTYLYKYGFDVPAGAKTITLPNNQHIKVLALSVANASHDEISTAQPISDTLADHTASGAPSIEPAGGTYSNATEVRIDPPLYYHAGSIRYTLDGSKPTASSPAYKEPFLVNDPVTIKVAQVDENGNVGEVASAKLQVHDTTPASVLSASVSKSLGVAKVTFSEPITRASAEDTANYKVSDGATVVAATLGQDHKTVELTINDSSTDSTTPIKLTVTGVKDLAHTPNVTSTTVDFTEHGAVFTSPELEPKVSRAFNGLKNLPVKAGSPWTLNLFCKIDNQPEDRTMVAGFGRSIDGRNGTGRYFTKFSEGINFWIADQDIMTSTQLDTGKWQMLTATYDGTTVRVYKNGVKIGEGKVKLQDDSSQVRVMPVDAWERKRRFDGEVQHLTVWDMDLPEAAIKRLWEAGQH